MPRKPSPNGPNWSFYLERNARYNYQYVKASRCQWNPEKKQPRTTDRVHVGRLFDDGRVALGKTFLEKFPQYQGKEIYYFENKLLERDEYLAANPDAERQWQALVQLKQTPRTKEDLLEEDWRSPSRQCGPTFVAWFHLVNSGMLEGLQAAFGEEDGSLIAALAVYTLCAPGAAMENFSTWLGGVYLGNIAPVSGQRISELLSRVTSAKTDMFFKQRFNTLLEAARKDREERARTDPDAATEPLSIAFDSTSISTYSNTIANAEYGHAKANPELRQINLALACDQKTGEIVFSREYAGSINDCASFSRLFGDMKDLGFHVEEVELVSDRGYKSAYNTQAQIDAGIKFVHGLRLDEDSLLKKFDKYLPELRGNNHFDVELGCSAMALPCEELGVWRKNDGTVVRVQDHLFFNDAIALDAKTYLFTKVNEVIRAKNENKPVPAELWSQYRKCVFELKGKDGEVRYERNMAVINERLRYSGCFALRTNSRPDPREALKIYRQRARIESCYRTFKDQIEGERTRATQTAYAGKLFIFTLATSVRMHIGANMRRNAGKMSRKVPNNSLDAVLMELSKVQIHRRGTTHCWVPAMLTKKQRDYFALLGAPTPRGTFRS